MDSCPRGSQILQIWVEEWIGKSATITKIPDLDGGNGAAGSRVVSVYAQSGVHFFILLVVQGPQRRLVNKMLTLYLLGRGKSYGSGSGNSLDKITKMNKNIKFIGGITNQLPRSPRDNPR